MMGDNRDNSRDSRYFLFVPEDNIVGRSSRGASHWITIITSCRGGIGSSSRCHEKN